MRREIIVATGNKDKMIEIRQILGDSDFNLVTMKEAGLNPDIVENGTTFEENALIKARSVMEASGKIAIADDSGLVVDAMGGEPGIHSARWMGHDTSYDKKNQEIIRLVDEYCAKVEAQGLSEASKHPGCVEEQLSKAFVHPGCEADGTPGALRSARYVCAVAVVCPDGTQHTTTGVLEGRIHTQQRGNNGFGYDPIFYLPEYGMTSGEIPREEKNRIGHRGKAFREMRQFLLLHFSENRPVLPN